MTPYSSKASRGPNTGSAKAAGPRISLAACLLVGADQRGLEKCTDDAERVITSQLAAACPQDRQFEASGEGGAFVEQTRLTHTARPLYDTNLAAAVLGRS